jgi:hypothetical protein
VLQRDAGFDGHCRRNYGLRVRRIVWGEDEDHKVPIQVFIDFFHFQDDVTQGISVPAQDHVRVLREPRQKAPNSMDAEPNLHSPSPSWWREFDDGGSGLGGVWAAGAAMLNPSTMTEVKYRFMALPSRMRGRHLGADERAGVDLYVGGRFCRWISRGQRLLTAGRSRRSRRGCLLYRWAPGQ